MKTQDRLVRGSSSLVLVLALLAALAGTMRGSAPAQETGRLVATIVDESGQVRGGPCVLVIDAAGSEQNACDDDGDGTIVVDGLAAGGATVKALQGAEGCAGAFGGEVEIPADGETGVTLTDACEPVPPEKEDKKEQPDEEAKPTEEPRPDLEPGPPDTPTPTMEVKPTEEPQPTATVSPTPSPTVTPAPTSTPTPTPPPTTGNVVITLTSATHGTRSLGACFEVLDRVTAATLAAGCDNDDGSSDGETSFSNLPPGPIVVQQVSGDHNDNPAAVEESKIAAGWTTTVDLSTLPLADLVIVPVAEDGGTPLYDTCFAVFRGVDYSIGRDACAEPDGRVIFANLPAYYWRLVETVAPTVSGAGGLAQPYELVGPPSVYHNVEVDLTVIATHRLQQGSLTIETVGADFGQPVYGACAQIDGLATGSTHLCDSDMDGQIVLSGLPAGDYTVTMTGNAETLNQITYRASEPGSATWSPGVRIEAGAMDRTIQIGFVRTPSFFVTAINLASRPVTGACYTVYAEAANGVRTALDHGCVGPYNTFKPWGEVGMLVPRAGRYVVVQTTTPYGYATPAEQWIDVIATGAHAGTQWVVFYPDQG